MPLNAEVGSTTQNGNQSIDLAGAFQPKAIIGWSTYTAANPAAHARMSIGFADGTSQACVSVVSADAAADSDTNRKYSTDRFWEVLTTAGGVAYSNVVSSLDADGFSVTSSGVDANNKLSYLALGGSDLTNAKIVTFTGNGSAGAQSVTGVGFKPDCVIVLSAIRAVGSGVNAFLAYGFATADAQYGMAITSLDAQATMDAARIVSNTSFLPIIGTSSVSRTGTFAGFTNDGFTVNWSGADTVEHVALCLKFTSPSYVKAGHVTTGTANGQTITASGLGHTPKSVLLMGGLLESTFDVVNGGLNLSVGGFDDTRQAAACVSDEDGAATSFAKSRFNTNRVFIGMQRNTGNEYDYLHTPVLSSGQFSLTAGKTGVTSGLVPYLSFGQPQSDDRRSLIAKALSGIALPMKTYLDSRTLDSTLADGPEISLAEVVGGFVHIPTGSSITSLTWYTAPKRTAEGGTYVAAHDENGTAITQTVAASKSYAIPPKLLGAKWAKAVPNADGAVEFTFAKA